MKNSKFNIEIGNLNLHIGNIIDWKDVKKNQDLYFKINTIGGDLHTSICLMRRMIKEEKHIITENFGHCQSSGFTVFCGGDERISHKENMFMIHSGNVGQGSLVFSITELLRKSIDCYITLCRRLAKISNKPYKYWFDLLKTDRQYFFTGKEMYKVGIVTKLK